MVRNSTQGAKGGKNARLKTNPVPFQVHTMAELEPYRGFRYSRIYNQMKWQRPMGTPLLFLQLPGEIRNMVYREHLRLNHPLEIWIETGHMMEDDRRRRAKKPLLSGRFRRHDINLGLLRACKQVNLEAASIFYGENEFRFSGPSGHMVAYAFGTRIGTHNLQFLKQIAVAIPIRSWILGIYGMSWNPSGWTRTRDFYANMPFPLLPRDSRKRHRSHTIRDMEHAATLSYEKSWHKLASMLAQSTRLQRLRLVMNEKLVFDWVQNSGEFDRPFSAVKDLAAAIPSLEIEVVRLASFVTSDVNMEENRISIIKRIKRVSYCHTKSAPFCPGGNWTPVEGIHFDEVGRRVLPRDWIDNEDVLDTLPDIWKLFIED